MFLSRTPFKWIINEVIKLSQWIFLLEVFFHESIRIKVQWWWIAMVDAYLLSWLHTYTRDDEANQGSVHTETFSCVFVLFIVLKGIENNQLITWNNTKKQQNVSMCTGSKSRIEFIYLYINPYIQVFITNRVSHAIWNVSDVLSVIVLQ